MIASIFRPSRIKNGKRVRRRCYYGQFRLTGQTKLTRYSLDTTDREVAWIRLMERVKEAQRASEGLAPPTTVTQAARTPLDDLFDQYLTDLRRCGKDDKYTDILNYRLCRLARECGWENLKQIKATAFEAWRVKRADLSAKTSNEYLTTIRSFMRWLLDRQMLETDPLRVVKKVQQAGRAVRLRRALTGDELLRLLNAAGPRMPLYLTAVTTGLRRGEIESLVWRDVELGGDRPYIRLKAQNAKNRRAATIPLRRDVASVLAKFRPTNGGDDEPIFPRMRRLETWKADLKAAGIAFTDAVGRRADFHALRHCFCSMLAQAGVPQRIAQEAMRHSDPKLTAMVYTDPSVLNTAAAIESLPITIPTAEPTAENGGSEQASAHRREQNPGKPGLTLADAVAAGSGEILPQPIEGDGDSRALATDGTEGQKSENGSGGRARTYNLGVNSALLYH